VAKVIVGISGGVDSSVAAFLLRQEGYEVEGMFMINWHDTTGTLAGDCPWNDDLIFAELVARKLEIPLNTVDFSEQYRKRVVDYMFSEYQQGRTPNPDVLCNREVKFDLFLDKAKELGADFIATGHYCRKDVLSDNKKEIYRLLTGSDPGKEQSYFLCQLSQQQLKSALFPIGHLHKSEIRRIAAREELATAKRKDSQGICFVGKVDLPEFLQQKLAPKRGEIIEIDVSSLNRYKPGILSVSNRGVDELDKICSALPFSASMGKIAGHHRGAHFYTIGQRKGLNVGGKAEPLFVLATDTTNNIVYVGQGHEHPGLNRYGLFIPDNDIHWIREDLEMRAGEERTYSVRIRYRQPLQKATLYRENRGMYIVFKESQRGITPGQFAAWYHADELLGSGVIA
jgi:tRNA-uridine 2-sulfurtransferase